MAIQLRIFDFNYPLEDAVSVTATSELSTFEASNLQDPIRSNTWRSGGWYVIETGVNDSLDFDEGSGELTATLQPGGYSRAELLTEIKTRMDNVGSDTYTVSFIESTGKFRIASDGATLSLLTSSGTNTATAAWADIGFSTGADYTSSVTYDGAYVALHTVERVIVDLGTTEAIDSFGLLFDVIQGNILTEQAVVKLKASATANFDVSTPVDVTLTIDEEPEIATHFFSSDQSYRYWAVEIVDPQNPNLFIEIGNIALAKATQLTQGPEIGFKYSLTDRSNVEATPYGHEYVDVLPQLSGFSFSFAVMLYSDIETLMSIYRRTGTTKTVAIAFDPTEDLFDKDKFFLWGKFRGNFAPDHEVRDLFDYDLSFEETA